MEFNTLQFQVNNEEMIIDGNNSTTQICDSNTSTESQSQFSTIEKDGGNNKSKEKSFGEYILEKWKGVVNKDYKQDIRNVIVYKISY